MTFTLNSPTSAVTTQKASASATASSTQERDGAESKRLGEAARQFEAVFLRQILSNLQKTASLQGGKDASSNIYGSMMVDAVADAVSQAGGIGLATLLKRNLEPQVARQTAVTSGVAGPQNNGELDSILRAGVARGSRT